MSDDVLFTAQQLLRKIGRRDVCALCGVKLDALRRWHKVGIPTRHWPVLVKSIEWVTYELLERSQAYTRKVATKG